MNFQALYGLLIGFVIVTCISSQTVAAQPVCRLGEPVGGGQILQDSIRRWENSRKIGLSMSAKYLVTSKFCEAVRSVAQQLGFSVDELVQTADSVLLKYLDSSLQLHAQVVSMSGLIASEVALGGSPTLPEPKILGTVRVTYSKRVDTLLIAGYSVEPWPTLLAEVGVFDIAGVSAKVVVCQGKITVRAAIPADFQC